jgi:VIT1/CCC1 family predicted Fe2+/Mn2+ transporter
LSSVWQDWRRSAGLATVLATATSLTSAVFVVSLLCLTLGALAARTGGASMTTGAVGVVCSAALAMAATAGVGKLFGMTVG